MRPRAGLAVDVYHCKPEKSSCHVHVVVAAGEGGSTCEPGMSCCRLGTHALAMHGWGEAHGPCRRQHGAWARMRRDRYTWRCMHAAAWALCLLLTVCTVCGVMSTSCGPRTSFPLFRLACTTPLKPRSPRTELHGGGDELPATRAPTYMPPESRHEYISGLASTDGWRAGGGRQCRPAHFHTRVPPLLHSTQYSPCPSHFSPFVPHRQHTLAQRARPALQHTNTPTTPHTHPPPPSDTSARVAEPSLLPFLRLAPHAALHHLRPSSSLHQG